MLIRKFHANDHRVKNIKKNGTKKRLAQVQSEDIDPNREPKNSHIHLMQHTEHLQIENYFLIRNNTQYFLPIEQSHLVIQIQRIISWMSRCSYVKNSSRI